MFKDTRGLEMTASSQEAVDAFDAKELTGSPR